MKEYLVYEEKAKRSELIVRIFYSIPIGIILYFYAILRRNLSNYHVDYNINRW